MSESERTDRRWDRRGITVIVPVHNGAETVRRAVASVLDQAEPPFEVVVVDDGSTDESASVASALGDPRVRVVRQERAGVCAARNAGARSASFKMLTFLDADDEALPGWLAHFHEAAAAGAELATCASHFVGPGVDKIVGHEPGGAEFAGLPTPLLAGGFCIASDLFDQLEGFRDGLGFSEHTDLALRLGGLHLDRPIRVVTTDRPLVRSHRRAGSPSPERLYRAAVSLIEHDHQHLARRRAALATYQAIAGVNAAKLGRAREARGWLRQAVRSDPRQPRHWLRLVRASVPHRA